DAGGLALAPGFIDMHAHSDLALLRDPDHSAKAAQGVTLEVIGQDGLSYAPVDDRTLAEVRSAITGWNGDGSDIDFDWRTVGEYLDRLDRQGTAVNAAYLVPQGTVRILAMGWADRPPSDDELAAMKRLVAEGMEQGAVGMSSGLTYTRACTPPAPNWPSCAGWSPPTAATTARTTAPTAPAPWRPTPRWSSWPGRPAARCTWRTPP